MNNMKYIYNNEEKEALLERAKKERKLTGHEIREILIKRFTEEGYLINKERNDRSTNEHPFDLIAGKEEQYEMNGFEIKGDSDTFDRLGNQLQAYSFVFRSTYLVLHKKKEPEWIPDYIGVMRVMENGEVYILNHTYKRDLYDIGSDYEWDSLLKSNGLGKVSSKCKESLKVFETIRANVLFNRFFGKLAPQQGSYSFDKFYPLNERQKMVIIGFDVPFQMKLLNKDIKLLEDRIIILRKFIKDDQTTLEVK